MQKIIKIEKEKEYMQCMICNTSEHVKRIVLGSRNCGVENTTSLKLCNSCLCGLRKAIDDNIKLN